MKSGRAALISACVVWAASAAVHGGQADLLTLQDGIYSDAQGKRGKVHYDAFCAPCHLGDLNGTLAGDTGAPPLRGAPFMNAMERKGVAAVFDYLKTTMPADDPASLTDREYLDILVHIIQINGFPAGARELNAADLPRVRVGRPSAR